MAWVGSWLKYLARMRLAPYVPSPPTVGDTMLTLANLQKGEVLVDLGCGDGRLLRQAVSAGASKAIGYELDADLVESARNASAGDDRIIIHEKDALQARECLAQADVVALYLTERGNSAVLPLLREALRPTARVVSYCWGMPGALPPTRTATATGSGVVVQFPNVLLWSCRDLAAVPTREDS